MGPLRYVPSSDPRSPGIPQQDTLYRASDAIQVRVRDLSKVGAVIDSALAHGILQISNLAFSATTTEGVREELLREATLQAKRQATAIAEASGGRLGSAITLGTDPGPQAGWGPEAITLTAGSIDGGATQVIHPSIPVAITVYGRWALLPKP